MSIEHVFGVWLTEELDYQNQKFSHTQQVQQLRDGNLTRIGNFGGQALSYWQRYISSFPELPENDNDYLLLKRTQLIGKITPSITSLWRTIKTQHKSAYDGSDHMPTQDIIETALEAGPSFVKQGQLQLATKDVGETDFGIGLHFFSEKVAKRGGLHETNLGIAADLLSVREIYLDAAKLSIAQFELCYNQTGQLPRGGISSGNIQPWTPNL